MQRGRSDIDARATPSLLLELLLLLLLRLVLLAVAALVESEIKPPREVAAMAFISLSLFFCVEETEETREREREKRNSIEWRESLSFFCLDWFAKKKKKKIPFLFLHS